MAMDGRFIPAMTPETKHFWEGTRQGRLILQKCEGCSHVYFPPRPFCPECNCRDVSLVDASGRASLHSYVISHLATPGFEPPFAIAVVELEEGPRMMTNIVNVPQTPEALMLDMALSVTFKTLSDDISLALFEPAGSPG